MVAHTLRLNAAEMHRVGMDEARRKVNRVVRRTYTRSQILCPVDDGPLRASGQPELGKDRGSLVIGGVVYSAEYAAAVHNGRRALTIRAKTRANGRQGRLKFTVNGRTVYAKEVHQPARAGRPFLATAFREVATQEGFAVVIG